MKRYLVIFIFLFTATFISTKGQSIIYTPMNEHSIYLGGGLLGITNWNVDAEYRWSIFATPLRLSVDVNFNALSSEYNYYSGKKIPYNNIAIRPAFLYSLRDLISYKRTFDIAFGISLGYSLELLKYQGLPTVDKYKSANSAFPIGGVVDMEYRFSSLLALRLKTNADYLIFSAYKNYAIQVNLGVVFYFSENK